MTIDTELARQRVIWFKPLALHPAWTRNSIVLHDVSQGHACWGPNFNPTDLHQRRRHPGASAQTITHGCEAMLGVHSHPRLQFGEASAPPSASVPFTLLNPWWVPLFLHLKWQHPTSHHGKAGLPHSIPHLQAGGTGGTCPVDRGWINTGKWQLSFCLSCFGRNSWGYYRN